jgi:hypothetical protein
MGYAIWTFDLVTKHTTPAVVSDLSGDAVPRKGVVKQPTSAPDMLLYENCPQDWTLEQATERALHLCMRFGGVYIARALQADGEWSPPTYQQWRDGVTHVERTLREQQAKEKRKRQLKKMGVYYE